jgi:ribosome-binding ATPase
VRWVRHEIHRWIYNNIKAKWPSVVRLGADRLVELLSGYQMPRTLSIEALQRAGIHVKSDPVAAGEGAEFQVCV